MRRLMGARRIRHQCQRSIGNALMLAQFGGTAEHVKPFKGVGSGVFEIVESHHKNAYRMSNHPPAKPGALYS
jgi:phage-related protein